MSISATLQITKNESDEKVVLNVSFDDNEADTLSEFVKYAEDLLRIDVVRNGAPGKFNLKWDKEKGMTFSYDVPEENLVLPLLHRIRPFVLKKESTYVPKIVNLLSREFDDNDARKYLKYQKDRYLGKIFQKQIVITSNNVILNSEEVLLKWLNAHEYHRNRNLAEELEGLHKIMPLETSRAFFIMLIFEMVESIFNLASFIKSIIDDKKNI